TKYLASISELLEFLLKNTAYDVKIFILKLCFTGVAPCYRDFLAK
ncbi:hypothetical protein DFR44_13614, partial [Hydromonas duriensis]